jgi:hypothetical protein
MFKSWMGFPFFSSSFKLVEMQKYSSMTNKNEEGKRKQREETYFRILQFSLECRQIKERT